MGVFKSTDCDLMRGCADGDSTFVYVVTAKYMHQASDEGNWREDVSLEDASRNVEWFGIVRTSVGVPRSYTT